MARFSVGVFREVDELSEVELAEEREAEGNPGGLEVLGILGMGGRPEVLELFIRLVFNRLLDFKGAIVSSSNWSCSSSWSDILI